MSALIEFNKLIMQTRKEVKDMPDTTTPTTPKPAPTPNPSTFRQVIENMSKIFEIGAQIEDLMASVGEVSELPLTIKDIATIVEQLKILFLDPKDPGTGGDVVNTGDGIKIIGVHVNTAHADEDTPASMYPQGLTIELKNVAVIGLAGKPGMSHPYCFVFTMKKDSVIDGEPDTLDYSPQQIAYANDMLYLYTRFVNNTTGAWGEWKERKELEPQDAHQQIVDSVTEPVGQREGDYWLQLLDRSPDPVPTEYMFETIAPDAETAGDVLETLDADKLSEYEIM